VPPLPSLPGRAACGALPRPSPQSVVPPRSPALLFLGTAHRAPGFGSHAPLARKSRPARPPQFSESIGAALHKGFYANCLWQSGRSGLRVKSLMQTCRFQLRPSRFAGRPSLGLWRAHPPGFPGQYQLAILLNTTLAGSLLPARPCAGTPTDSDSALSPRRQTPILGNVRINPCARPERKARQPSHHPARPFGGFGFSYEKPKLKGQT